MMFSLARIWHFIDENAPNPAQGIVKFKEQKRKRWLKPEELPALVKAIDADPSVYVRGAIWLYLLTGVRKSESRRADGVPAGVVRALELGDVAQVCDVDEIIAKRDFDLPSVRQRDRGSVAIFGFLDFEDAAAHGQIASHGTKNTP